MTTTTVLMIIIALNALATINLWREAVRRPARPSEKFIKALLRSEPIVPKHGTPTRWTYEDDTYIAKYERTPVGAMFRARRLFFYDFADFAVIKVSRAEAVQDVGCKSNHNERSSVSRKLRYLQRVQTSAGVQQDNHGEWSMALRER